MASALAEASGSASATPWVTWNDEPASTSGAAATVAYFPM
eukprot:CAMPEP_0183342104 /NCGR_PEP_ID=MMETSP0164_2-20130417/8271_1 /TAXON_ID=221442 /ORGANISM="Coccolithus pelagicus ssp braarudi, Strain PLY182g" /LENGTH=39 /DNA_ID= /DNA_START= /DNA_END= /DNA_ORIENTATION=